MSPDTKSEIDGLIEEFEFLGDWEERYRYVIELGRSLAPIDVAVAAAGSSGLRIFIGETGAVATVAAVLEQARAAARTAARGPVQLCLMDPGLPGEVEMDLGQDFAINPEIRGAIKSLDGVVTVEDL